MKRQRRSTRFSDDGLTVFARLRVDRRAFEFARHWAFFHAKADPAGTAEEHLEGYLDRAMLSAMEDSGWQAPPEIEALYPPPKEGKSDMDDGIPF
jgi:hypothetical protein